MQGTNTTKLKFYSHVFRNTNRKMLAEIFSSFFHEKSSLCLQLIKSINPSLLKSLSPFSSKQNPFTMSSVQQKLKKSFQETKTVDEMLTVFQEMESCFQESDLGFECLEIAETLLKQCPDHQSIQKVVSFAKRALTIFEANASNHLPVSVSRILVCNESTVHCWFHFIASVCYLLGCVFLELKNYEECLGYLDRANEVSRKLEDENGSWICDCVSNILSCTQTELFKVKYGLGRRDEAVVHLRKVLEIKEKTLEEGCIEVGEISKEIADVYIKVVNFKEARSFCLKALGIYEKHAGRGSMEVARLRGSLGVIYNELGEYEKALDENQFWQSYLKSVDQGGSSSSDLLQAEVESTGMLIEQSRHEEAIEVLKRVLSHDEMKGGRRVVPLLSMAKTFCYQGDLVEAKKYMGMAQQILEEEEELPTMLVAVAWGDMSLLHEDMKEYETAISLLRRVLSLPELPQEFLSQKAKSLFELICVSRSHIQGIPYLEDVLERLKESFGPTHFEAGYGYQYLGLVNLLPGRSLEAIQYFENAKVIFDASFGPDHLDSLTISHQLSMAYSKTERYDQALACQQKVVEGFEALGPSEQNKLDEAILLLNLIKRDIAPDPQMTRLRCLWCRIL